MDLKGRIVFSSGRTGDYDIWSINLGTKKISQLTSGPYWNDCPKWSPDGKKILFISNRTGTPEVWLMNEDGTEQKQITNSGKWHDTPDWSFDGQKIVCCANYSGNIDIFTMNVDGSELTQITDYPGMDFTPQFSPDNREIIFASERSGNCDIWSYDLGAKQLVQRTTYKTRDFSPTYSPDGSAIAFVSMRRMPDGRENLELHLMDKNGGNIRRITHNAGIDRYAGWSPCGRFLVYTSALPESLVERIMIMDVGQLKMTKLDFDRAFLAEELDAQVKKIGLFYFLSDSCVRLLYPKDYFGSERFPDWTS